MSKNTLIKVTRDGDKFKAAIGKCGKKGFEEKKG